MDYYEHYPCMDMVLTSDYIGMGTYRQFNKQIHHLRINTEFRQDDKIECWTTTCVLPRSSRWPWPYGTATNKATARTTDRDTIQEQVIWDSKVALTRDTVLSIIEERTGARNLRAKLLNEHFIPEHMTQLTVIVPIWQATSATYQSGPLLQNGAWFGA